MAKLILEIELDDEDEIEIYREYLDLSPLEDGGLEHLQVDPDGIDTYLITNLKPLSVTSAKITDVQSKRPCKQEEHE